MNAMRDGLADSEAGCVIADIGSGSFGNVLIEPDPEPAVTGDRVVRRPRLGGLLNFYCRAAA